MARHFHFPPESVDPGFLFFPKIYPIGFCDLPYFFRWCLTAGESRADDDRDFVYVVRDLKATVNIRPSAKSVRRKDAAALVGKKGWLQARLLTVKEREESPYLLVSLLTERVQAASFDVFDPLLDFVTSVGELKDFPSSVEKIMAPDFERAKALSLAHWREHRMRAEKTLVIEKMELCEKRIGAIEEQLVRVKRELGRTNGALSNDEQRQHDLLLGERAKLRTELLSLDDMDSQFTKRLIKANARAHETEERTLFSIQWTILQPSAEEDSARKEARHLRGHKLIRSPMPKRTEKR